jgi:hypothetical protein
MGGRVIGVTIFPEKSFGFTEPSFPLQGPGQVVVGHRQPGPELDRLLVGGDRLVGALEVLENVALVLVVDGVALRTRSTCAPPRRI